jgi:hypothetical protein
MITSSKCRPLVAAKLFVRFALSAPAEVAEFQRIAVKLSPAIRPFDAPRNHD